MAESCRFAFAIHIMAVLGSRPDEFCSSRMLAQTVNTNPVVIRRLLLDLHKAGLVTTGRGPAGGARFRGKPERVTLGDIYRAVEDRRVFATHPRKPSKHCPVGCRIEAALARTFEQAARTLEGELDRTTLKSFLQKLTGHAEPSA
ncbi:MAG: Rrf2 family transcriptional regulator [Acidobacteriales bacterium]|nr:Rrf2 family transcriptional regulator [Terriglobales bacterium]